MFNSLPLCDTRHKENVHLGLLCVFTICIVINIHVRFHCFKQTYKVSVRHLNYLIFLNKSDLLKIYKSENTFTLIPGDNILICFSWSINRRLLLRKEDKGR